MTKKRYRKTARVSRSGRRRRSYPFPDHFSAAHPAGAEQHPVDTLIDSLPEIAARRRKLVRMAKRWQRQAQDEQGYIKYEDSRLEYFTLREQVYFNAGFERGLLAGRTDSRQITPSTRAFAHQLGLAVAGADLPRSHIAAALIDVAKAVIVGLPLR